jgi:CheY-like chemotaxis protein
VSVASSGREALSLLAARELDLAFCDLAIFDITGMVVYARVREAHPGRDKDIAFTTGG